jgi:membrane carboxypeptidase/penicillin-binding protein PbpC
MAANAWCPSRRIEWVAGEAIAVPCSWHHLSDDGLLTVWPPEYREWAQSRGLEHAHTEAASQRAGIRPIGAVDAAPVRISSPPDGGTYLVDPTLRREFQALPLRAATREAGRVQWSVDGRVLGTASSETTLTWPLRTGRHTFQARDQAGRTATATITVR